MDQKISPSGPDTVVKPPVPKDGLPNFPGQQGRSPGMKPACPLGCKCPSCREKQKGGMY